MTDRITVPVGTEKLYGIFESSDTPAHRDVCIISCHGLLASKDSPKYIMLANELNSSGFSSIRFDFRGCGESEGLLGKSHISNRLLDLKAVIDYAITELGFEKFGLFGSSMGAFISFLAASKNPRIKAIVSLASPFSMTELFNARGLNNNYEIDGVIFGKEFLEDVITNGTLDKSVLKNIKCPVLIFHGNADGLVPVSHAQRLFDNLNTKKSLKIIQFGDHIFSYPAHLIQIVNESVEWYKRYL
jgi:pimeloyl-ACP methyl ester carboxylesterase